MDSQEFLLDLLRLKFGLLACFHYIFIPLTLGLIVCIGCLETAFVRTRDVAWQLAARFWFRLFALAWILGIITGYPLRAQLAGDWSRYSAYIKPLLERILPIEADLGPVMLIGLVTIAVLQGRPFPKTRMLAVWGLVAVMIAQSVTILTLNAWMQHPNPTGALLGTDSGTELSIWNVFCNPMAISKITHVLSAALVCGTTLMCAVAVSYLYRRQHLPVARVSLRLAVPLGVVATTLVIVTGHLSAEHVARFQPMKFAAFEGLWRQEYGPAGLLLFAYPQPTLGSNLNEVRVPYLMSLLSGYGLSGSPPGIRELLVDEEEKVRLSLSARPGTPLFRDLAGYRGLYEQERDVAGRDRVHQAALRTVPNVPALFGGFHVMVSIGFGLLALYVLALTQRKRLQTDRYRGVLLLLPWLLPLPWLASFAGWIVAEMGRQPWVIYGQLSTMNAIQRPPLDQGVFGLLLFVVAYMLLGMAFGLLSLRLIRLGPEAPLLAADWWKWLVREPRATEVEAL